MSRAVLLAALVVSACSHDGISSSADGGGGLVDLAEPPAAPAALASAGMLMASAVDAKGRVYALATGKSSNGVDVYSPADNQWTAAAGLHAVHYAGGATTGSDGRIYVFGGIDLAENVIGTAEVYSPDDDTWTLLPPMPTPRVAVAVAADAGGRIYVIGGSTAYGAGNTTQVSATGVVEVFSIADGAWSMIDGLQTPRIAHRAVTGADGKIYVLAGRDTQSRPLDSVEVLDPATSKWSAGPALLFARYWAAAALGSDGSIYVMGGVGARADLDSMEAFSGGAWVVREQLPAPRVWHVAATGGDGRLYVFGGTTDLSGSSPQPAPSVWAYQPAQNQWQQSN